MPFLYKRVANRHSVLPDRRAPVGTDAALWEPGDLMSEFFRFLAGPAVFHHIFAEADPFASPHRQRARVAIKTAFENSEARSTRFSCSYRIA